MMYFQLPSPGVDYSPAIAVVVSLLVVVAIAYQAKMAAMRNTEKIHAITVDMERLEKWLHSLEKNKNENTNTLVQIQANLAMVERTLEKLEKSLNYLVESKKRETT